MDKEDFFLQAPEQSEVELEHSNSFSSSINRTASNASLSLDPGKVVHPQDITEPSMSSSEEHLCSPSSPVSCTSPTSHLPGPAAHSTLSADHSNVLLPPTSSENREASYDKPPVGVLSSIDQDPTASSQSYYLDIRWYRNYFNVDTDEVLWRLMASIVGAFGSDFQKRLRFHPDLYGPFWISTTLVLIMTIVSTASFAIKVEKLWGPSTTSLLPFQPTSLIASTILFYGYIFGVSTILYLLMLYSKTPLLLVSVWCLYGYALTIFVPATIFFIFPVMFLRWTVLILATLLSGTIIRFNLESMLKEAAPCQVKTILRGVFCIHLGFGLALELIFF
uniref:Protein YIP n=1 Tax=Polytomella parva TaxID=51329 RepID=A0A7S0VBS6_9CHLO|mmetsp:Transcript_34199/g.61672  ORF Transcript_34199/g.61672 Transcript_34199/m.61672 type:complete len:334 (+) Transcript_34199:241-1242(+)